MRIVAAALLLLASLSAHGAIHAGPERPVGTPVLRASFGYHFPLATATDGTRFLTVWWDDALGRDGLYAAIQHEGRMTPAPPVLLTRSSGSIFAQAVWTGSAYLVLWSTTTGTRAVRLDADAQILDPPEVIPAPPGMWLGAMEWSSPYALAVFSDGTRSVAMLLDRLARVANPLIPLGGRILHMSVLPYSGGFVVIWAEEIQSAGSPIALTSIKRVIVTRDQDVSEPVEMIEPVRGFVTFDAASSGDTAALALRVQESATVLRRYTWDLPAGPVRSLPRVDVPQFGFGIQVASTPAGFIAAYSRPMGGAVGVVTVPFDDTTAPRTILLPAIATGDLTLVANRRATMAVVGGFPAVAAELDVSASRLTSAVTPLAIAPPRQSTPAIGVAPDALLMAWIEPNQPANGPLLIRRYDRAGNPLGDERSVAAAANIWSSPAVVFTGRVWLVAWQEGSAVRDRRVLVRRFAPDGTPLDSASTDLGYASDPALASNGSVAALTMTTYEPRGVGVVRFSAGGDRLDATPLLVADGRTERPAIASNGREFLAVWTEELDAPYLARELPGIFGVRLAESGAPVDAAPIAIAASTLHEDRAKVASDGTDFVVVYEMFQPPRIVDPPMPDDPVPAPPRVHAKRVLRTGVLADRTADQDGDFIAEGRSADIALVGARYVVTFLRPAAHDRLSLWAVPVDDSGARVGEPREIADAESHFADYAVAGVGTAAWVAYTRVAPEEARVQRLFVRTIVDEVVPARRRGARK